MSDREPSFSQAVYDIVRAIPCGKVMTYGQIADKLGNAKSARAVGNVLHINTDCVNIPCHRVVNRRGKLAANYAFGGTEAQADRLIKEGIRVEDYSVNLSIYGLPNDF